MMATISYSRLLLGAAVQSEFVKMKSCLKCLPQQNKVPIKEIKYNLILRSIRNQIDQKFYSLFSEAVSRTTTNIN